VASIAGNLTLKGARDEADDSWVTIRSDSRRPTMPWGIIVVLAVSVLLLRPVLRIVTAAVFGKAIGRMALSRQPDTIHLERMDPMKLRNAARVRGLAADFERRGFESAGVFSVPEIPGVNVQLLANESDSMSAVIYDHPTLSVFYEVVSRYIDGGSSLHTTARETGIRQRSNAQRVSIPNATPDTLVDRALRERPQHGLRSCSASSVASDFTAAYAEYMTWIKQRGISTAEVVEVAKRKAA
jgi:hypothetical protein